MSDFDETSYLEQIKFLVFAIFKKISRKIPCLWYSLTMNREEIVLSLSVIFLIAFYFLEAC